MKPSGFYDYTIAAGASANVLVMGDYFKIMSATAAVNVRANSFGEMKGLIAGQGLENTPFGDLTITNPSGASNTVRIFIGDENFIDGMSGAIAVSSTVPVRSAAFANTLATVTNAATQIDAANSARAYLLIQNKSTSGTIHIGFIAGVTAATGITIPPGGYWEPATIPTGAIFAIGNIASNPEVLIVEA